MRYLALILLVALTAVAQQRGPEKKQLRLVIKGETNFVFKAATTNRTVRFLSPKLPMARLDAKGRKWDHKIPSNQTQSIAFTIHRVNTNELAVKISK